MFYTITYVLFLCTQAHVDCEKAQWDAKTVRGIEHYEYRYGHLEDCQKKAKELENSLTEKGWYECRREGPKFQ